MTQVWGVTMMRDEADVAETCIRHMAGQGVNGIVVADNLSTDGTGDIVRGVAADLGRVVVVGDDDPAYRQSAKMTALAHLAHDIAGTDDLWIVPFDADELWTGPGGKASGRPNVGDLLRSRESEVVVQAEVFNHYATGRDDPDQRDPFRRLTWRDRRKLPLGKVAARWSPSMVIEQGNHAVSFNGHVFSAPIYLVVHHFPYRSLDQVIRKVRNGAAAYAAAPELPDEMGAHWKQMAQMLDRSAVVLDEHLDRWFRFEDPTKGPDGVPMVHDPVL